MDHRVPRASDDTGPLRIELPPQFDPGALYQVNEHVQRRLAHELHTRAGTRGRAYLHDVRCLPACLAEEEGIGFLPGTRSLVGRLALREGLSFEQLAEAGLVLRHQPQAVRAFQRRYAEPPTTETLSDFFAETLANNPRYYIPAAPGVHARLAGSDWMALPLRARDPQGTVRVAGFLYDAVRVGRSSVTARSVVPPPETRILDWRDTIVGLEHARDAIGHSGRLVITRGAYDQLSVRASLATLPVTERPGVVGLGGFSISRLADFDAGPTQRLGAISTVAAKHIILFVGGDATSRLPLLLSHALHATGAHVRIAIASDGRRPGTAVGSPQLTRHHRGSDGPANLWRDMGRFGVLRALERSGGRDAVVHVFERARAQIERAPPQARARTRITAFHDALRDLCLIAGADAWDLANDLRVTLRLEDFPTVETPTIPLAVRDDLCAQLPPPPVPPPARHVSSDAAPTCSPSTPKMSRGIHY